MKNAVVLLSGGLDSATVLAIAREQEFAVHALSFKYGQRHIHELDAATRVATTMGVARHVVSEIDLRVFGGSALTSDIAVPGARDGVVAESEVPITYVPARNTIFLSFALAFAEVIGSFDIFIGVNAVDYSGYPDCRPEYIEAFQHMADLATRSGIENRHLLKIHTPLIELSKAEIIRRGTALGVDYGLTLSCYDPDKSGRPCQRCEACALRAQGFADAGIDDPALTGLR
ncbi:MAG: 7-cyano-7-deazaguanine synthase [marine bacterium B5-7]|nr:MAG: 7-cyano-7-deazaguanine synthase [marine bacterium B5-7]